MEFTRLAPEELRAFLDVNAVPASASDLEHAQNIFHKPTTLCTEEIVDLHILKLLKRAAVHMPQMYTGKQILDLPAAEKTALAQSLALDPNDPHVLPRMIRIIRWLGYFDPMCGFNRWRNFNPLRELCLKTTHASAALTRKVLSDVTPGSIILFHYSDAVKFAETEAQAEQYNIFPAGYFNLTYAQRAHVFADITSPLNQRRWSRQQWPHNTIKYCYQNNIKLIYIQSDLIYCQYPSMFAEAMCGAVYFESESIEDMAHRFTGHNSVLYTVGEHGVAYDLITAIDPAQRIRAGLFGSVVKPELDPLHRMFDTDILRNDLEWANMSDTFRNSLYEHLLQGQGARIQSSYLYFPWSFLESKLNLPTLPVSVTVAGLMHGMTQKTITATYLNEIGVPPNAVYAYFKIKAKLFQPTWNIPLTAIFGTSTDNTIFISAGLDVVQPIYITADTRFEGTYQEPRIFVNYQEVNPAAVRKLVSLNP